MSGITRSGGAGHDVRATLQRGLLNSSQRGKRGGGERLLSGMLLTSEPLLSFFLPATREDDDHVQRAQGGRVSVRY